MNMSSHRGFNAMEILVVLAVIGVIAALSFSHVLGSKERIADKEAFNNLILLSAAQKDYQMDTNAYYASTDQTAIRQELKVMIPVNADRLWDYSVAASGCVNATRAGGAKEWALRIDDEDGKPNENENCS